MGTVVGIHGLIQQNQLLEEKFSVEKYKDEDGILTWKLYASGEEINNAFIYTTMYLTFWIHDSKSDYEITMEIPGYYSDMDAYYSNTDKSFYVKERNTAKLKKYIKKIEDMFDPSDDWSVEHGKFIYFTLNYKDYKKKKHNTIYTISDNAFREDNSQREIYGDQFLQLETVPEIPKPDIVAPFEYEDSCCITINYKRAETKTMVEGEDEYESYLGLAFADLINSKDKPVEEMLGETVLTDDGTAYIRQYEKKRNEDGNESKKKKQ